MVAESPAPQAAELDLLARRLAAPVERVFAEIDVLARGLAAAVGAALAEGRRPCTADLRPLRVPAGDVLAADPLPLGVGVVVAPGLLDDAERFLEWRQREPGGGHRALLLDVDPRGEDPYDYPEMEWFRVPHAERRRMASGPYLDYRGADLQAITLAVPVVVGDVFAGVAGADLPLATLEAELLPVLRRLRTRAAVLNPENRVVTANTPHFATGTRIPAAEVAGALTRPVLADVPWTLLVASA